MSDESLILTDRGLPGPQGLGILPYDDSADPGSMPSGGYGRNGEFALRYSDGRMLRKVVGAWTDLGFNSYGKSAYQIAVDHGFVGSEAAWTAAVDANRTAAEAAAALAGTRADTATNAATTAAQQAALSTSQATLSGTYSQQAGAHRAAAELAASAARAAIGGTIYESTSDGLTATSDGDFFIVAGDGTNTYAALYRHDADDAVLVSLYPSKASFDALISRADTPAGEILFLDGYGAAIASFRTDMTRSAFAGWYHRADRWWIGADEDRWMADVMRGGYHVLDDYGATLFHVDGTTGIIRFGGLAVGLGASGAFQILDRYDAVRMEVGLEDDVIRLGGLTLTSGTPSVSFALTDRYDAVYFGARPGWGYLGGFSFDAETGRIRSPAGRTVYSDAAAQAVSDAAVVPAGLPTSGTATTALVALDEAILFGQTFPRRELMLEVIQILVDAGVWAKLDVLYLEDVANPQISTLNWKDPAGTAKTAGGTTAGRFRADRWTSGNGTDYAEDTGWAPSSGVNFAQDDCCLILDVAETGPAGWDAGVGAHLRVRVSGAASTSSDPEAGTGTVTASINGAPEVTFDTNFPVGIHFVGRDGSADISYACNLGAAETAAAASSAVPAGTLKLFSDGATFGTGRLRKLAAGAWLDDAERAAVVTAFETWSRGVGSYTEPNVAPDPLWSSDAAAYGVMTSQLIPTIETFGHRLISLNYGITAHKVGEDPDSGPARSYLRIQVSDDGAATWTDAAFVLPHDWLGANAAEIIDSYLVRVPDGRGLLIAVQSGVASLWLHHHGRILQNPMADPSQWVWSDWFFLEFGFAGRPRITQDGRVLYCAYDYMTNYDSPPGTYPATLGTRRQIGNRLCEITVRDDAAASRTIATIPPAADPAAETFSETSVVDLGGDRLIATYRTTGGQRARTSADGGVTWGAEFELPRPTPNSKADLVRSPSGRLVWGFNDHATSRRRPSLALSDVGGDGTSFPYVTTFDTRENGFSYPSIAFGRDALGNYTGWIFMGYDHDRGKGDNPNWWNELVIVAVNEQSLVDGDPIIKRPRPRIR